MIETHWATIIVVASAGVGLITILLNLLKIQELRMKNRKLKRELKEQDNPIHKPTTEEIEKYGKTVHRIMRRTKGEQILPFVFVVLFFYSIYLTTENRAKYAQAAEIMELAEFESGQLAAQLYRTVKTARLAEQEMTLEAQKAGDALEKLAELAGDFRGLVMASTQFPDDMPEKVRQSILDMFNRLDELGFQIETLACDGMPDLGDV